MTAVSDYLFYNCSNLASVSIPASVTFIGEAAFRYCDNLRTVTLPAALTCIENYAFRCHNMDTVTCQASVPPVITDLSFARYNSILYVPQDCISTYQTAEYWKNFDIRPIEQMTGIAGSLADKGIFYFDGKICNEKRLDIRLFDLSGRLITAGNGDIDLSACPQGVYIISDGAGGALKIMR